MKKKIDKSINELKDYSKKIYLKGKRISIYTIFKIFKSKLIEDEIFERSLAVAYSFTLATFPLIIFLFTLIPYINTWVPEIDSIKINKNLFDKKIKSVEVLVRVATDNQNQN